MNSNEITKGLLKSLAILIGIALLLFFLYKIQVVIIYISIAAVISLIGRPIIIFLRKRLKLNNTLAVLITMLFFITVFIGLIALFIPLIVEQSRNLSLLDIKSLEENVTNIYLEITNYFHIEQKNIRESIKNSQFLTELDYSIIPEFLNKMVQSFGSFGVGLFSVLFILFFFLKDSKLFENGIITLIPDNKETRIKHSIDKIKDLLSRYFVGLVFQISVLFVIYTVVLFVFGIKNAFVIAFLCALFNLIPYIGPLVSAIIMMLLTMSSNLGQSFSDVILPKTIYVMIGFIFAQLVDNFFSQPFIFSKSVKSHPLEIFLVIIIAGILFGVVGMIVAIPSYTAIKVILKEFLSDNKIVKGLTKDL